MNQIIHTGEFPKHLRIAKVKPLFKKGNQSSFTNYSPISLLPSISKIFEHVMTSQLMEYFTSKNLFCLQQFGFRPGHSTELAALKLVNHIITEMDNCNIPTNIYIDLSKAFDTLNFDILLISWITTVYKDVQTGSFIVIFLTDGNLLISMGTNLAICL